MSPKNLKKNSSLITEFAFQLVLDSEVSEGFDFNTRSIDWSEAPTMLQNIDKKVILAFLSDENTRVSVERHEAGHNFLVASNSVANESIRIKGLADHYLALLNVVYQASAMREKIEKGIKEPLLTHEMICRTNLDLQPVRAGEVAIGSYRQEQYVDWLVDPVRPEVYLNSYINDKFTPVRSVKLATCDEVCQEMEELVDWVNNTAFQGGRDIMHDIAEFHARFIKIHPFRDGNGRTGRLLMNYLLLSLGEQMVTIPIEDKEEYCLALDYANTTGVKESCLDIENFAEFCKSHHKQESREAFIEFLRSSKERTKGKKYMASRPENQEEKYLDMLHSKRENSDKYRYLTKFLKEHQIQLSSEDSIEEILNNYGMKNVGEDIKIGSILADQVEYIPTES